MRRHTQVSVKKNILFSETESTWQLLPSIVSHPSKPGEFAIQKAVPPLICCYQKQIRNFIQLEVKPAQARWWWGSIEQQSREKPFFLIQ